MLESWLGGRSFRWICDNGIDFWTNYLAVVHCKFSLDFAEPCLLPVHWRWLMTVYKRCSTLASAIRSIFATLPWKKLAGIVLTIPTTEEHPLAYPIHSISTYQEGRLKKALKLSIVNTRRVRGKCTTTANPSWSKPRDWSSDFQVYRHYPQQYWKFSRTTYQVYESLIASIGVSYTQRLMLNQKKIIKAKAHQRR